MSNTNITAGEFPYLCHSISTGDTDIFLTTAGVAVSTPLSLPVLGQLCGLCPSLSVATAWVHWQGCWPVCLRGHSSSFTGRTACRCWLLKVYDATPPWAVLCRGCSVVKFGWHCPLLELKWCRGYVAVALGRGWPCLFVMPQVPNCLQLVLAEHHHSFLYCLKSLLDPQSFKNKNNNNNWEMSATSFKGFKLK